MRTIAYTIEFVENEMSRAFYCFSTRQFMLIPTPRLTLMPFITQPTLLKNKDYFLDANPAVFFKVFRGICATVNLLAHCYCAL